MNDNNIKYSDDEIRFLPPRDACRLRPSMYIGSTGEKHGGSNIYREILDNAMDVISSGSGDTILTSTNFNGFCFVADNGSGLPITMSVDRPNITAAELSISEFHSGSKFSGNDSNIARIGMNGVGSSATNFLSSVYCCLSKITKENYNKSIPAVKKCWNKTPASERNNLFYILIMQEGLKVHEGAGNLRDLEKLIFSGVRDYVKIPDNQSTIVLFKPDPKIFDDPTAEVPLANLQYFLLIQEKFFKRKVEVIIDGVSLRSTFNPFKFEIVKTIIPADTSYNKQVGVYITFEVDDKLGQLESYGSVNGLSCNEGTHITLFKNLFKTSLRDYYKIKHDCLLNGLKFCIIILANELQFSSQTKESLKQIVRVKPTDFAPIIKEIEKIFKKNPEYWDLHAAKLNKLAESMKNIGAIDKAQKFMDSNSGLAMYRSKADLPRTFVDATSKDRSNCELFIVEGNSACASLVMGRPNTKTIGCLGLRGKILNVTDKSVDRALESKVIYDIFNVIGLGLDINWVGSSAGSYEEEQKIIEAKSRFSKIIIATDSDSDGSSIFNEILYLFSKFARFLIDHKMVYRALSPLFRGYSKSTKRITYYYPDDPFDSKTAIPLDLDTKKHFDRWKGLGSLSPETGEVYDSFYNPQTRRLVLITPDGIDYSKALNEDIDERKKLLFNKGILSNPYNFTDI